MADTDLPSDDEQELLAELRAALGPDPVPEGLVEQCAGLVAWADVDRELAELLELDDTELAGVRGTAARAGDRLQFEVEGGTVVDVVVTRDGVRGQVVPLGPSRAVLERLDGEPLAAAVDELGQFGFDGIGRGSIRLRLEGGPGHPVVTDWFVL